MIKNMMMLAAIAATYKLGMVYTFLNTTVGK